MRALPTDLMYARLRAKAALMVARPDAATITYEAPPFRQFIEEFWSVLEPAKPFVPGWHIDAIAAYLEAVTKGEIRRLVVNIPPRYGKSLIISVFWPVWSWTFQPSTRWLFVSYRQQLATRDALKSRRVILSPRFQALYGDRFMLAGDQNEKTRYENERTGYRISGSLAGGITGEGGDFVIADDPHNVRVMESDVQREAVLDTWDQALTTRLNDPEKGALVIVMQRLHEADLSGHVLAQGGYEHLCLPAVAEQPTKIFAPGGALIKDRAEGELLWPEHVGPAAIEDARKRLGPYGFAGQMQQSPSPRGGGLFKRDWWQRFDPRVYRRYRRVGQFMDSAFKEGVENDFSTIATWAEDFGGNYYVLDRWRAKLAYPDLMQAAHDVNARARAAHGVVPLTIEDKASGQSAIQTLRRPLPLASGVTLPRLTVIPFPAPGNRREADLAQSSKEARAESVTPIVASGRVFLPADAPWVEEFIEEHERFPAGAHDDQVDTTSMALIRFADTAGEVVQTNYLKDGERGRR